MKRNFIVSNKDCNKTYFVEVVQIQQFSFNMRNFQRTTLLTKQNPVQIYIMYISDPILYLAESDDEILVHSIYQ